MDTAEGAVEMDVYKAVFFVRHTVQIFLNTFAYASHGYDHMFCIRSAVIVKEPVGGSQLFIDLCQLLFHYCRQGLIIWVGGLSGLEKDGRILGGAVDLPVAGMETLFPEPLDGFHGKHGF